jgi:hypothetical protein
MSLSIVRRLPTTKQNEWVQLSYTQVAGKCKILAKHINVQGQETPIHSYNLPKEFRLITNPLQFKAFFKEAYVKAPRLSDGNYGLAVYQRIKGGAPVIDISDEADLPAKTMALVRKGLEELAQKEVKKNAVLMVGRTGAGKSILANLLCEVTIVGVMFKMEPRLEAIDPIFPFNHSNTESCTTCPIVHGPKNSDFTYIDYPGFDDSHGAHQDITNAFFRKEVLKNVNNLKIVLVVGYTDLSKRGRNLIETFNELIQFLGIDDNIYEEKVNRIADSISLVVSQVPPLENNAVKVTVSELLENYLADDINLSKTGKMLLERILIEERWRVFSTPTEIGTCPKTQSEKSGIWHLIHKQSKYLPRTETDIQVKVSQKYSGTVQTSLQYLVRNLKKKFAERIFEEINTSLQKFITGVASKKGIIKFQKRFQQAVNSTETHTLYELLKDLSFLPNMFQGQIVDEAKDVDESIKFLRDLLPAKEASTIPHRRDWIQEFELRPRLLELNNMLVQITTTSKDNLDTSQPGKLLLQGYFLNTSQITSVLSKHKNIREIEIHAFHTVTIDENLEGKELRGVNVTIIAPKWEIVNHRKIVLTGLDCPDSYARPANDGASEGEAGHNGAPGGPGENGGHFFGIGIDFSGIDHLTIVSNGGTGGTGQQGGNGRVGQDGAHGRVKYDFVKTVDGAKDHGTVIAMGWDYVEFPPFHHGNGTYDMGLRNNGQAGLPGGNAGLGGHGGHGGHPGNIRFVSLLNPQEKVDQEARTGTTGTHGQAGAAGEGGKKGMDWGGTWHLIEGNLIRGSYCDWNGHDVAKPRHSGGGERAASGSVDNNNKNSSGIQQPAAVIDMNVVQQLFNYRTFAIKQGNPLIMQRVEIFRRTIDTHPEIQNKSTIPHFLEECEAMERFYLALDLKDKSSSLPLYLWMAERILMFDTTGASPADIVLLNALYTQTLSKILQIKALLSSRLIIDVKGFLDLVLDNINTLENLDHAVQVGALEQEYVAEINGKITEADHYLQYLSNDIRAADKEIDVQIKELMQEIDNLQKNQANKKSEIEAKRKELKEQIERKKWLGGLAIVAQCIGCFFPPAGPIVAGAVSAGLSVASNPNAGSGIASQLLTSYTTGISQVLQNQTTLGNVHLTALERVRTLTLVSHTISAVGSGNQSEEEQLKAMDHAIQQLEAEQKKLNDFKSDVSKNLTPSLHQVVDGAEQMQKSLISKSKIALDFSRMAVSRSFENIKEQLRASLKSFNTGKGFINIVRQLEQAIDTSAQIYERIEDYKEKRRLVQYLAKLAAPTVSDPRLERYKQEVQRNLVLEQYSRAVAAVRQWAFPFASLFLGDFTDLDSFSNAVTIHAFMNQVKDRVRALKTRVAGQYAQIDARIDTFLFSGPFNPTSENGSFYIWKYSEHDWEIRDLLRGQAVSFVADINRTSSLISALKFKHIELQITSKKPLLRNKISNALKGVRVAMKHSGLSNYRYENQIFQMSNDEGFTIKYGLKGQGETPDTFNEVFRKMKEGSFMLSPYTQWTIKLVGIPQNFIQLFEKDLTSIELHLVGHGQFVQTERSRAHNLDLSHYQKNIYVGSDQPVVMQTSKAKKAAPSNLEDNALKQKDNEDYLYQATDIAYIAQSPTIAAEFKNFHFIQGMQADHLRKKVDEIAGLARIGKPVLCVYNIDNIHWAAFCMLKKADGTLVALYKDSFGASQFELVELLRGVSEFRYHPEAEQRGDGTSCGIFAMENIRIMARALNADFENFIANFETQEFCSLERARALRKRDFATLYAEGVQAYEDLEAQKAVNAAKLRQTHQPEVERIIAQLKSVLGDITVQTEDLQAGALRTISIHIGAETTNFDTYHYRIQITADIPLQDLQHILIQQFAWCEGEDYRVENNVIKVTSKI